MNSGAILNRINFGVGVAAGRFPGATLSHWSEMEHLKAATREQQVDAVILAFFGGQSSPDTREILLNGENPLAAKLSASVPADSASADLGVMGTGADNAPTRGRVLAPAKNGAPRPAVGRALGQPVQLNGLAQVVGLAIGAPEFQRR